MNNKFLIILISTMAFCGCTKQLSMNEKGWLVNALAGNQVSTTKPLSKIEECIVSITTFEDVKKEKELLSAKIITSETRILDIMFRGSAEYETPEKCRALAEKQEKEMRPIDLQTSEYFITINSITGKVVKNDLLKKASLKKTK